MFIRTEELSHIYMPGTPFAAQALKGVNINIEQGSFCALAGPSGSGKSTLIQHFNGLISPTSGRVLINGKEIRRDRAAALDLRRRIGLVFQMPEQQFFAETVAEEVGFAPRNLGFDEPAVRQQVQRSLALAGLDYSQIKERSPFHLSSGQKRLVAIAAVLALEPEALIMDEPTAGLDASGQKHLFRLLKTLNRRDRLTIILVTHHLDEVVALADQFIILDQGRVVISGPPEDIFSRPSELARFGLAPPPVSRLMHALADGGLPVSRMVFTLQEARREIMSALRRGD